MNAYAGKTLIVVLCMHRSGSSFVTNVLHRLGMSLGPFELFGALPSNKYGHFEAMPVIHIQRPLQERLFGFSDEMPPNEELLRQFVACEGRYDVPVPDDIIEQGRAVVKQLVASRHISGFKDPHTPLLWPYWLQVFASFPGLRVVPVFVIRSPHEIAMSLFMRNFHDYHDSLAVTAVHYKRMNAIYGQWQGDRAVVRYKPSCVAGDLQRAARWCGLPWSDQVVSEVYDSECRHHDPAPVAHEAQSLYERLERANDPTSVPSNPTRLEQDAAKRESIMRGRIEDLQSQAEGLRRQVAQSQHWADLLQHQGDALRHEVEQLQGTVADQAAGINELQQTNARLKSQIDRFEGHALLGPVLRARRRIYHFLDRRRMAS